MGTAAPDGRTALPLTSCEELHEEYGLGSERRRSRRPDDPDWGSPGSPRASPASEGFFEAQEGGRAFPARTVGPEASHTSFRAALELIALVAAPTALVTALAYYFGVMLTAARAEYFGIDNSVLHFTTRDYLLRSVDALFVPLGALFVAALAGLAIHALAQRYLRDRRAIRPVRWTSRATGALGFIVFVICVYAVFRDLPFGTYYLLPSIGLGIGLIVVAYAVYIEREAGASEGPSGASSRRPLPLPFLVLVGCIAVLSVFWAASDYASALGRGRAEDLAANLDDRPGVVVYSEQQLGIGGPGVTEQRVGGTTAYRFRYEGLRLLIESDKRFFLLPRKWTPEEGAVIVLPESPSTRLEFRPGS
jgi:hypothetical protein